MKQTTKLVLEDKFGKSYAVESPKLAKLMSEECTVAELQAALVHLITIYNEQGMNVANAIKKLERRHREVFGPIGVV